MFTFTRFVGVCCMLIAISSLQSGSFTASAQTQGDDAAVQAQPVAQVDAIEQALSQAVRELTAQSLLAGQVPALTPDTLIESQEDPRDRRTPEMAMLAMGGLLCLRRR